MTMPELSACIVREGEGVLIGALSKQSPALAEEDRVHHEPAQVDEVLLPQHVEELGASGEQEAPARFLLECADLGRIAGEQL